MDRQLIKDLKDKDVVETSYLVKEKNISVGKNGRSFMTALLGDATGQIDSRLWDNVETLAREFEIGDVIKVKGQIQLFQNRRQLILHRIERLDPKTVNVADYIAKSNVDPETLFVEVLALARSSN